MRLSPLLFLGLTGSLLAGEISYPLWDGQESVADYAKRVNLPPTQTLDLSNNVKLELVLIPAGQFIMGTPEPLPVDEDGFRKRIVVGQALLAASAGALLVMLAVVIVQAIRKRRRPQLSLGLLLLVTVAAGGAVLSALHWRQSARGLEQARVDFIAAKARFDSAEQSEKPAHAVTLTQPFYMGKFTVTQAQYQTVIGANPSHFKGKDNPVETVSWDDAQAFCAKLAEQTKQTVRMPTEAEWEYACRAGTTTMYHSGDTEGDLARVAWYWANSISTSTTHPIGQKEPNAFGLYDMHGNVWQWCQDLYGEDYYEKSEAENPQGPAQGVWWKQNANSGEWVKAENPQGGFRLLRGGSWYNNPMDCRSAERCGFNPDYRDYPNVGLRVVVELASRTP